MGSVVVKKNNHALYGHVGVVKCRAMCTHHKNKRMELRVEFKMPDGNERNETISPDEIMKPHDHVYVLGGPSKGEEGCIIAVNEDKSITVLLSDGSHARVQVHDLAFERSIGQKAQQTRLQKQGEQIDPFMQQEGMHQDIHQPGMQQGWQQGTTLRPALPCEEVSVVPIAFGTVTPFLTESTPAAVITLEVKAAPFAVLTPAPAAPAFAPAASRKAVT